MTASERVENPTAQAITLPAQTVSVGAATPMGPRDQGLTMGVYWYNGDKAEHADQAYFNPVGGCMGIGKRPARTEYTSGSNTVYWAAAHNQFFAIAVAPATNSAASLFTAHRIELPRPTAEEIQADAKVVREPHGIEHVSGGT